MDLLRFFGAGLDGGVWTFAQLLLTAGLVPSLLAGLALLLLPPRRDEDGLRRPWRILLRLGLATWGLVLATAVLSFALLAPAWAELFATFGASASLPVPTQWLLTLSRWIARLGWITAPLTLLVEVGYPVAVHRALHHLPERHDWLVPVSGGLVLALFSATVGIAAWLPLLTLARAVGP